MPIYYLYIYIIFFKKTSWDSPSSVEYLDRWLVSPRDWTRFEPGTSLSAVFSNTM